MRSEKPRLAAINERVAKVGIEKLCVLSGITAMRTNKIYKRTFSK